MTIRTMLCAFASCVLASSCGSEPESGEAPLHIRASLEIAEGRAAGRDVVALLYADGVSELHLQELDTQGKFPSDLQLELREPPPEAALRSIGHLDEPAIAVGFLTAVPELHPESMRYSTRWVQDVLRTGDRAEITYRWCDPNDVCYTEERECQHRDDPPEQCGLKLTHGDPALKAEPPWDMFAGVSQNYVIVYVSQPLAAGSVTAALLAAPNGLSAGYHVLSLLKQWDSEVLQFDDCRSDAQEQALAAINDELGTEYEVWQVLRPCQDEHSWTVQDSAVCELPLAEREALRDRLDAATWRSRRDRGCQLTYRRLQPIAGDELLEVQLQEAGANSVVLSY